VGEVTVAVPGQSKRLVEGVDGLVAQAPLAQADADVAERRALIPAVAEPLEDRGGLAERSLGLLEATRARQGQAVVVQRVAGEVSGVQAFRGSVIPSRAARVSSRSCAAAASSSR
jgi:hypothetical protein